MSNYSHHPIQKNTILETTLGNVFAMLGETSGQPTKPSDLTDSRLEQNILFTIRRHQESLNWLIERVATGKVRPRTRKVLWWALTELLYLDGAAVHAVVDTATHYVKKHHAPQEASFVNAILRRVSDAVTTGQDLLAAAPDRIRLEMPETLWKRWTKHIGEDRTREIAEVLLRRSPVMFRWRLWPECTSPVPDGLTAVPAPEWFPEARLFTLEHRADLGALMKDNPQLYIQDPATLLAPALLAPHPGETVADLCAAPGGKSRILAELMHNAGRLLCRDKSEDKIPRIQANLRGFSCADIRQGDAMSPDIPPQSLDAVLLDVPCTNTGVLRRKPDAKWSFDSQKLSELTAIQSQILEAALPLVRPGGRLVYSTCSLEPEENTLQVQAFLKKHPSLELVRETQLFPEQDHDGAFAALISIH